MSGLFDADADLVTDPYHVLPAPVQSINGQTGNVYTGASDWRNVRTYGAAGDGATDDTTAIQAAISALPAAGGVVYFPVGTYKVTSAITLRSDLTLRGAGQDKTIIRQYTTTVDALTGTDISYLTVADLQVYGPGSGSGNGINLARSTNPATPKVNLTNVVAYNFGGHGITISNPIVTTITNVSAIGNAGHGFDLHGVDAGAAGTSVALTGCYGNANHQAGYNLRKMVYCALVGCAADGNGIGYLIDTSEGVSVTGSGCETPTNYSGSYPGVGFKVTGSVSVSLINTWLAGNAGTGWWVTGNSTGVHLVGPRESAPSGGATAAVKVDAGSAATLLAAAVTTANNLAGTTTVLTDTAGDVYIPHVLHIGADTDLYRAASLVLQTDGKVAVGLDVECLDSGHGLVLHDRSDGHVYRLKTTAGVLGVEQIG